MRLAFLAVVVGVVGASPAVAGEISDYDRTSLKNSAMITAAQVQCSTLSVSKVGDIYLDERSKRSRESDDLLAAWVEGSELFRKLAKENRPAACVTILRLFPSVFQVTVDGVTISGDEAVKKLDAELPPIR